MWHLGKELMTSRLLLGTASYPSPEILSEAIQASDTEIITVSVRRQTQANGPNEFWNLLKKLNCRMLPNTAGCHSIKEAVVTAQMASELFETHWIKLEVIGDDYTLAPNPFDLVKAAEQLVKMGFDVFPYCTEDLILCQRLMDVGCRVLMPWAAPIGSGRGISNPYALQLLRERFSEVPIIIDAGIGKPSDAAKAMEMGFDGCLLNSAVALSGNPVEMARAFSFAIRAGRLGYEAGLIPARDSAKASTPIVGKPFWHEAIDA